MSATRAIAKIHRVADSWVRVERVHRARGGMRLDLSICKGKNGPVLAEWVLTCRGVREAHIEDLDGGGLQLSDVGHPAARQYTDAVVKLVCSPQDLLSAIGVLFQAHLATVDDWIPFDRYLGLDEPAPATLDRLRLRGPSFLMARYARALRKAGVPCKTQGRRTSAGRRGAVRVMHFGNSFIVAGTFDMRLATPGEPGV